MLAGEFLKTEKSGRKGGTVMHHPNPEVGEPHFHPVTPSGEKLRPHYVYPKK